LGVDGLARDYLRPGADAVGYSINSGLYNTARVKNGCHFWAGVRGMWTYVPQQDKSFVPVIPSALTSLGYAAPASTATIMGGQGATLHSTNPEMPDVKLPNGLDMPNVYLVVPQVCIGSLMGTELMVRGIPSVTFNTEIGKVSFFGAGLKHSFTNYIPLPFDIAVMGTIQTFKVAELLTVSNESVNLIASLPLGPLTAFGGVGYENYAINITYRYQPPSGTSLPDPLKQPVDVNMNITRRNLRATLGIDFKLIPLVDLTADYSFGIQDNFTFGVGVGF
jgi:hypothetical protein